MFQPIIHGLLAQGGQADVYRGQLHPNGQTVVFKVLRDFQNARKRKEFIDQIGILSCTRAGVVPVIASDIKSPQPWYAMPYYPGGNLNQYVGRLSSEQLISVATYLAKNLAAFHITAGAFGDLKPLNILVSQEGFPILADPLGNGNVGLLSFLFPQQNGGTREYMAPEVRAGGPMSIQADMYSFAATLFHLCTGQVPQEGQDLHAALQYFSCPAAIRELIFACAQRDPNSRATMKDVQQLLKGNPWKHLLRAKRQAQLQKQEQFRGLVAAGVFVGLGVLAIGALAGKSA